MAAELKILITAQNQANTVLKDVKNDLGGIETAAGLLEKPDKVLLDRSFRSWDQFPRILKEKLPIPGHSFPAPSKGTKPFFESTEPMSR